MSRMTDRYASLKPTPERDAMNAFPFWWEKIKDAPMGELKLPRTIVIPVPADIQRAFYLEDPGDFDAIRKFVDTYVQPAIRDAGIGLYFVKNGGYSHKFDASRACLPLPSDLAHAVVQIMNEAMIRCGFQYNGTDFLVIRERIWHNPEQTPCIYNGLPFRTEFRVFYDFDEKKVIFCKDYWDKNYVRPNLRDRTDRIIYDHWHPEVYRLYKAHKSNVANAVAKAMSGVEGLSGPWSVDVMLDEDQGYWLIDMAVAEMSAYWEDRPGRQTPGQDQGPGHDAETGGNDGGRHAGTVRLE